MKRFFPFCLFLCCVMLLMARLSKAQIGQWTWMKGSNTINQYGLYQSVPTTPGSRKGGASWTDGSGNLWVFGGEGFTEGPTTGLLNDLWKFDKATSTWAWVKGSNQLNQTGTYGTQGVAAPANTPGARRNSAFWTDNAGNLWLFGGMSRGPGPDYGYENDLWKYEIATASWTWIKGGPAVNLGAKYTLQIVTDASASPGARMDAYSWMDNGGNLWLFGGNGYPEGGPSRTLNDLWKYNTQTGNWACIKGISDLYQQGIYGTQGVASDTSYPGNRYAGASWKDAQGNFWLFGGIGNGNSGTSGYLSDLWKLDVTTGKWAWIKGSAVTNNQGNYGNLGTPAATNNPRCRSGATSWTDKNGNFWLFGGTANTNTLSNSYQMNDLWKYDMNTNTWTWMKGSSSFSQQSNYGVQGVEATTNTPGSRLQSTGWTDTSGNLWLMGGRSGLIGTLNDLWKYDISTGNWTWMKGASTNGQSAVYGTAGVAAPANTPGGGQYTTAWTDRNNCLWLFGGLGYATGSNGYLNSIWKYDIATGNWAWIKGSTATNQPGNYGTLGTAAASNIPGSRSQSATWADGNGSLWLFGGTGYDIGTTRGSLNDLWKYNDGNTPLPLTLTGFSAIKEAGSAQISWQTSYEQNITAFTIERSNDSRFSSFTGVGRVTASGNTSLGHNYHFTDASPLKGSNYYRLKITEKDGKVRYSEIRLLNFGGSFSVVLFPNPAKSKAVLSGVEAGMSIRTISATGQTITIQKATGNTVQMPVNLLPAGLYQVQVYGSNGILLGSTTMVRE